MDSKETEQLDARVRAAYPEGLLEASAVQRAVRERIALQRARLWMTAVSAAVVIFAIASYTLFKMRSSVYAELARDHRREVTEQQPRRWRTQPSEIAALIARYGVTAPMVSGLAPTGYRLEHAKTCAMAGKPILHLVYTNGAKELSVYVRQRDGGEAQPKIMKVNTEQVATLHHDGFEAAIVMEGSGTECLEWARRAVSIL